MIHNIAVVGAGTMGSGIALAAAQNDLPVILFDINEAVLNKARAGINNNLDFLLNKQKITSGEKSAILDRIVFTTQLEECRADLIIEAIIEKLEAKVSVFTKLAAVNLPQTILASNTSSLAITAIQQNIPGPGRVAGMHFFNPAHIMKLVEIVKGDLTSDNVAQELVDICIKMKKTPVLCNDAPGFIVNRVARHYYLEAMRLVEHNIADLETVDILMESAGFKMGPFKLMDLIGMDINLAVSESIYEAFGKAPRFKPSPIQVAKVAKGELGRKTKQGFYNYEV